MKGRPGVVVHDFQQKLDDSHSLSDEPSWREFYERIWPGQILAMVRIDKDSVWQRWGVDREIKLVTGQQFTIDEKKRTKDYGDMLIEETSMYFGDGDRRNQIGWSLDLKKRCDYVAYAVVPAGRCWLLHFDLLRRTARRYLNIWREAAGHRYPVISHNRGYVTKNVPVPWDRLWADMRLMSEGYFAGNPLPLPKPFVAGDQLYFEWGRS